MPLHEALAAAGAVQLLALVALVALLAAMLLLAFNTATLRLPWAAPPSATLRTMVVLGSGASRCCQCSQALSCARTQVDTRPRCLPCLSR